MANKQLPEFLTAENDLDGQEPVYIAQGGKTRKALLSKIKDFIIGTTALTTTDKTVTGSIEEIKEKVEDNTTQLNANLANPSILINGDFRNPVNQRNITNIPVETVSIDGMYHYFIDRWFYQYLGLKATIVVDDNGVLITSTGTDGSDNPRICIGQPLEIPYREFAGKDVTLSFDIETNSKVDIILAGHDTTYTRVIDIKSMQGSDSNIIKERVYATGKAIPEFPDRLLRASIVLYGRGYLRIKNAKLELGSKPTQFIPRPYDEELYLCRRYYERVAGSHGFGLGFCSSESIVRPITRYSSKRIRPTMTTSAPSTFSIEAGANGNIDIVRLEPLDIDEFGNGFMQVICSGGLTIGDGARLKRSDNGISYIDYDAEIY